MTIRNQWVACEAQGCYLQLIEWNGNDWLESLPMLKDGSMESDELNEVDVSLDAFDDCELIDFCLDAAKVLGAPYEEVKQAIRG